MLKDSSLNFVGNVEGHDIFTGEVDVIVMDGFTGNVVLKTSESLAESHRAPCCGRSCSAPRCASWGPGSPAAPSGR